MVMTTVIDDDDGIFDDYPGVDQHGCKLLGPTALVVQGLMGILVIASLLYKRQRETPKRPWRIWMFDVSKQVAGQLFVHFLNVLISGIIAEVSAGNPCVTYFLNILIDTTLGVAIIYLILHVATYLFTEKLHLKGFESGQYGHPPSVSYWARQAAVYVFALSTMKILVVLLLALWPGIFKLGEWLLSFLGSSNTAQVVFVMGLFPITMNILQFWLIDSIVKDSSQTSSVALPSDTPRNSFEAEDHEPLFNATSDDEDDDNHRPHDIENPPSRHASLSRSLSRNGTDRRSSSMSDEPKSTDSASTIPSGSTTPKLTETGSQSIAMHAYPPSRSASPTSTISSSLGSKKIRKSPPPALALRPRSPRPARNATPQPQIQPKLPASIQPSQEEKEWDTWGDDPNEDWGEGLPAEDNGGGDKPDIQKNLSLSGQSQPNVSLRTSS
ncbi:hypothetical protein ABKN59_001397 [Abortiporus biennis]